MSTLGVHANELRDALAQLGAVDPDLRASAESIARSVTSGGKLLAAGNGGSAAEAQHLTSEFIGRLHPSRERRSLPAVALHADTSTMTALANDYGYEEVFARQVQGLGATGDVLVVLSTSGASPNLVRAVDAARERGMTTIGLLGRSPRPLHERCDHVLAAPSDNLSTVQECHLVMVHVLVEYVEDALSAIDGDAR
jgi:D-sedoheptulose 7-phosphate isomerase